MKNKDVSDSKVGDKSSERSDVDGAHLKPKARAVVDANLDSDFSRTKPMTASKVLGGHDETLDQDEK